jgi:hypothetical protein
VGAAFLSAVRRSLAAVPAGLAAALITFTIGYWGLRLAIYGAGGSLGAAIAEKTTHTPNRE